MSRSEQQPYIPVKAFWQTDLFIDRISRDWDSRRSLITNHKN